MSIYSATHESNPMHLDTAPHITIRSNSSMYRRGRKTNMIIYRITIRRRRKTSTIIYRITTLSRGETITHFCKPESIIFYTTIRKSCRKKRKLPTSNEIDNDSSILHTQYFVSSTIYIVTHTVYSSILCGNLQLPNKLEIWKSHFGLNTMVGNVMFVYYTFFLFRLTFYGQRYYIYIYIRYTTIYIYRIPHGPKN